MEKDQLISAIQQIKTIVDQALEDSGRQAKPGKKGRREKRPIVKTQPASKAPITIDFDKPLRPFVKQYGKGMSGPQKFTLLLAKLVKGDLKKEVQLKEVERQWNKMKALMDKMAFNNFYASQAKDRDWVETQKRGFYNLRPNWKHIFK